MSEELVPYLKELVKINKAIEDALENKKIADEALKKTPEYFAVQSNQAELKELQEADGELRTVIKDIALSLSRITNFKDREPVDGVKIKHFDVITILDEKAAKIWLANNASSCLSIKKSDTDKVLKALELDFVKKDNEFRVEIASNLDQYLEKEE